jgi:circadian clock protein KaiB
MKAKSASRRPARGTKQLLRLYIAGQNGKSRRALKNLKEICDRDFPGQYKIEIVDVWKNAGAAQENNLLALPAVVRALPAPIRKFIGTFSDKNGNLVRVDLAAGQ